jgi:hypothetical protein
LTGNNLIGIAALDIRPGPLHWGFDRCISQKEGELVNAVEQKPHL